MNQMTMDLLTKICDKCGGRCCYYARPPLTEERISILIENGVTFDEIMFREHRMLDCKSTGFCIGWDGRCRIQQVKPETCVAGPSFDICDGSWRLPKKDASATWLFLKSDRAAYDEQFELAVQNIQHLVRAFPRRAAERMQGGGTGREGR